MKQLIVTADDFGYSRQVNKAIINCFKSGIVTSASLIANTKYFDESIKLLKQNKRLDVGIHVNLTEFRPLTKAKSLVGKNGNFVGKREWFAGFYRKADKKEIEEEMEAQIGKAVTSGLKITHLNGHNHAHVFPNVIDSAIKIAKRHRIKNIRVPSECGAKGLVNDFSRKAKQKILKSRLKAASAFYGILNMGDMDFGKLSSIVKSIKAGTSELMVHPAYIDRKGDDFHQSRQRENEIALLTDKEIIRAIKKLKIKLTNFSKLSEIKDFRA